jgi:hypothetical protein
VFLTAHHVVACNEPDELLPWSEFKVERISTECLDMERPRQRLPAKAERKYSDPQSKDLQMIGGARQEDISDFQTNPHSLPRGETPQTLFCA